MYNRLVRYINLFYKSIVKYFNKNLKYLITIKYRLYDDYYLSNFIKVYKILVS